MIHTGGANCTCSKSSVFVSFSFLPDSLCSVLWNLYHYYKQFVDRVQAKIVELRSPLEKELKVR